MREEPEITAITLTWGDHVNLSEETVESFLRQTYPHKHLLIVNTHPDPVTIEDRHENIKIINHNSGFYYLGEKLLFALDHVKTPFWCMMDDDDIYLPWHMENLVTLYNKHINMDAVGDNQKFVSGKNIIKAKESWGTWNGFIFRRMTIPKDIVKEKAFDHKVLDFYAKKVSMPFNDIPSYIYRWDSDSWHYSSCNGDPMINKKRRDEIFKLELDKPWVPHWDRDYVNDVLEFMKYNEE